jgi:hypothetical protein
MLVKLTRILAILLLTIFFLFLAAFAAFSLYDSPEYTWRLLRYGQSDTNDYLIFPERPIQNSGRIAPLVKAETAFPQTFTWVDPLANEERVENLDELFHLTDTKAFIVVQDDKII